MNTLLGFIRKVQCFYFVLGSEIHPHLVFLRIVREGPNFGTLSPQQSPPPLPGVPLRCAGRLL